MKKRFSIKMLAAGLVGCLAFSFGVANLTAKADNETAPETPATVTAQEVETFEMADGAGVRVRAEDATVPFAEVTGIRFSMYFNKTVYSDLVVDGNFNSDKYEVSINISDETGDRTWDYNATKIVEVSAEDANTTEDVYAFRAVLAGFDKANYGTNLTATGFVTVKGETETTTEVSNPQTRSVAQVASKAYLVETEKAKDTKGDLLGYINGYLETNENAFKFENASVRTDDYRTATLNEQIGVNIPNGFGVVWTNSNGDAVEVNEETNEITLGEEYGVSELTATLGTTPIKTKVTYGEPAAWIVDETNYTNVSNSDMNGSRTYKTADEMTLDGGYTGNAVAFRGGANSNFIINNTYTTEELKSISKDYNRVKMWVSFGITAGTVYLFTSGFEGIAAPGTTGHSIANGKANVWISWTISISDYIALIGENEFFRPWGYDPEHNLYAEGVPVAIDYYFGNVEFGYEKPTVVTVNENTHTYIYNPDGVNNEYISAESLKALNIAGEYTGNAKRFMLKHPTLTAGGANNGSYRIKNDYTEEQLLEFKEKFNTVSVWMAATGIKGATLVSYTAATYPNYFAAKAGGASFNSTAEWKKISLSIDLYMELLALNNYAYCPLIRLTTYNGTTFEEEAWFYVGDVFFENV